MRKDEKETSFCYYHGFRDGVLQTVKNSVDMTRIKLQLTRPMQAG